MVFIPTLWADLFFILETICLYLLCSFRLPCLKMFISRLHHLGALGVILDLTPDGSATCVSVIRLGLSAIYV